MKPTVFAALLALLLSLGACQVSPNLAATPLSGSEQSVFLNSVTSTPEAKPANPLLRTSLGDFAITSARFVDEANGERPQPGEKLLLVILAQPNLEQLTPDQLSLEAFDQVVHDTRQGGIYLLGSDGSHTISTMGGWIDDEFTMGFRVPTTVDTYTLYWPGNDPIDIVPTN